MALRTVKKKLPTPRLQLRWAPSEYPDWQWQCHYELVIHLQEGDIRRNIYKNDRLLTKKLPKELAIEMKKPSVRNGTNTPCEGFNFERFCDAPYRDGAHAKWDAEQLKLPVYVIAPDGMTFLVEDKP